MGCYLQLIREQALQQYRLEMLCYAILAPHSKDMRQPQLPDVLRD